MKKELRPFSAARIPMNLSNLAGMKCVSAIKYSLKRAILLRLKSNGGEEDIRIRICGKKIRLMLIISNHGVTQGKKSQNNISKQQNISNNLKNSERRKLR